MLPPRRPKKTASVAAVQLLHVHAPLVYATGISILDSGTDERAKDQESAYLDRMVRRWMIAAPDVRISTALLEGFPPDVLREQTSKADLVVMATHGHRPVSNFWLGSVADALVRIAAVPLLLLRPNEQPPPVTIASLFRHLMIPLDGSDLAEQVLKATMQLGRLMGASYTLLRVVNPDLGWPAMTFLNETQAKRALDEAQAYLHRIAERLRGEGLTVQTRSVLHTNPADAILDEAREQGADLLGLATHGRGGLRRLLLGSVADKVLRGGTTPMLVCRPRTQA